MPKALDKEEPPSGKKPFNNIFSNLKLFFQKLLSRKHRNHKQDIKGDNRPVSKHEIIRNINDLTEKTIEDVMVPRSDIVSVSIDASLDEINKIVIDHAHTRTLVYEGQNDNIVGFIHIKDLFEVVANNKKTSIKSLIRKHIVSPYSMKLIDLLTEMQKKCTHLAVIVDEYGSTDGLVTIEDIIEEIVGKIDDEHDIENEEFEYQIIKPGVLIANARTPIDKIEEILYTKLKKQDDEFDTIAGLIMTKSGHVPEKGEIISISDDIIIEILESTPRSIKRIQICFNKKIK